MKKAKNSPVMGGKEKPSPRTLGFGSRLKLPATSERHMSEEVTLDAASPGVFR